MTEEHRTSNKVVLPSTADLDVIWRAYTDCVLEYYSKLQRTSTDRDERHAIADFLKTWSEDAFVSIRENLVTRDGDVWSRDSAGRLRHGHDDAVSNRGLTEEQMAELRSLAASCSTELAVCVLYDHMDLFVE